MYDRFVFGVFMRISKVRFGNESFKSRIFSVKQRIKSLKDGIQLDFEVLRTCYCCLNCDHYVCSEVLKLSLCFFIFQSANENIDNNSKLEIKEMHWLKKQVWSCFRFYFT